MGSRSSRHPYVSLCLFVAGILLALPDSIVYGAPSCKTKTLTPLSLRANVDCAQRIAAASCALRESATTKVLASTLGVSRYKLLSGLRQLSIERGNGNRWCALTAQQWTAVFASAVPLKLPQTPVSRDFNEDEEREQMPASALDRAVEQRRAIMAKTPAPLSSPTNWENLTAYDSWGVGSINALLIHATQSGNIMLAGTDGGGIWISTDNASTWHPANDGLPSLSISSFAMRSADTSTIYAGTGWFGSHTAMKGGGILKSTDGGLTWTRLSSTQPSTDSRFQYVNQLAIDSNDSSVVVAATAQGAVITRDGGTTWNSFGVTSGLARAVVMQGSNIVIGMDDGTAWVSSNGGNNFSNSRITPATSGTRTHLAIAKANANVVYALLNGPGNTAQLWASQNGGTTWTQISLPSSKQSCINASSFGSTGTWLGYDGGIWIDPLKADHIAVMHYGGSVTSNGLASQPTWSECFLGWADFHGAVEAPGYNGSSNQSVYFFSDGGLYRTDAVDSLTQNYYWPLLPPNGIVNTEATSVAGWGTAKNLVFAAQDVGAQFYTPTDSDPTSKWRLASGGDGFSTAADPQDSKILYSGANPGRTYIIRTRDGGKSVDLIAESNSDLQGTFAVQLAVNSQRCLFAGGSSLWRSCDAATAATPSWSNVSSSISPAPSGKVTAIAIAASNPDVMWIAFSGKVYKTGNATAVSPGWSAVTINPVPPSTIARIYIDPTNPSHVYLGFNTWGGTNDPTLMTTTDGGVSNWSVVACGSSTLPCAPVYAIQQHPNNPAWIYLGTAVGLFHSENGGTTWSTTNEGPATVQVRDINWYSKTATSAVMNVATYGRGIWQATADGSGSVLSAPTGFAAFNARYNPVCCSGIVSTMWEPSQGATSYRIYRTSNITSGFTQVGTTSGTFYEDYTAARDTAYLYAVRAYDGSRESANSNIDLATVTSFTDPSLTARSTKIKAAHVRELRTAVNAVRFLAGLSASTFTDPTLSTSVTMKAMHINELRTSLTQARAILGLRSLTFIDPTLTSRSSVISAAHIVQLRDGVRKYVCPCASVMNGDFEEGDAYWATTGIAAFNSLSKHSGIFGLQLGNDAPSNDSTAQQSFALPPNASTLSFWYSNSCHDTIDFDWVTATLTDLDTGQTTTVLNPTCNADRTWFHVTANVVANAGHNVTLTFTNHDDNYAGDQTYTYFDDITIASAAPPPPAIAPNPLMSKSIGKGSSTKGKPAARRP